MKQLFDPPGRLFFGDNLEVLGRHIDDETVDLVYLDPPFNSKRSFNLLFKHRDGRLAAAQQKAFDDTWRWDSVAAETFHDVVNEGGDASRALRALRDLLGTENDMLAYLTMMAPRLVEMHRVLKPTGWLVLHCDPTASHYLKLLLDALFGPTMFRNEVIWKRSSAHNDGKQGRKAFGSIHDVLLVYGRSADSKWNTQYTPYDQSYIESFYRFSDADTGRRYRQGDLTAAKPGGDQEFEWQGKRPYKGRYWAYSREKLDEMLAEGRIEFRSTGMPVYKRYLDEMPGVSLQDIWTDINPVAGGAREETGWSTQKPLDLLKRIISTMTDEHDVVLDPFCGCGTAIEAAQQLNREWVGIDITRLAIDVIRERLATAYPALDYSLRGEPTTIDEANALAELDKHEFQRWVCERLGVKPPKKKGADRGIDGEMLGTRSDGSTWRAIVEVKGGGVKAEQIRSLRGAVTREKADLGFFVTLKPPSAAMKKEAIDAGFLEPGVPAMQIITVADLLDRRGPALPTVRPAAKARRRLRAV